MKEEQRLNLHEQVKKWIRDELFASHRKNTEKCESLDEFNINPMLQPYLSSIIDGKPTPSSMAKGLIYPRVMGTSITTSFGQRMQKMIVDVFPNAQGSALPGIDFEFIDAVDGRKKYCQLKSGPNIVNKGDVREIKTDFQAAINRARANSLMIPQEDFVFCLIYGEHGQENAFIKEIDQDYTVYMGAEFWRRLTGDPNFYTDVAEIFKEVAAEIDIQEIVEETIQKLAEDIRRRYPELED